MAYKFNAYLDAFDIITIIIDKSLCLNNKKFMLERDEFKEELRIIKTEDIGENFKFTCYLSSRIDLHLDYKVNDEKCNQCYLFSGKVVRDELFDARYSYSGDLGVKYSKEATEFKLWSPVAKEIILCLTSKDGTKTTHALKYSDVGVWSVVIHKDIEGYRYHYNVRVNGVFKEVIDPYAFGSIANAKENVVIDFNKTYQMKYDRPEFSGRYVDAVIYEANIRDMTIKAPFSKYPGKYLGMIYNIDKTHQTAVEYIASLGVTHLQLMPIYDFGGVDELNPDLKYNWGYNPEQLVLPEGWYSTNPNDPYSRINELKEMIDVCHKTGLRVNMDVVFNHVFDYRNFPADFLVPGYYYRFDETGNFTEVSGCQNDMATERAMTRKFILDTLLFWYKEYKLDGFRFDLMGLLDVKTMNLISSKLKFIDDKVMLYGEGWNMPNTVVESMRAAMINSSKLLDYAFFNDSFRDYFRGNQWRNGIGYCLGNKQSSYDLFHLLCGSSINDYKFKNANQSINYVECHDNYTFHDYMEKNLTVASNEKEDMFRLSLGIVLFSQGIPFIHAGQEAMRTKHLIENSYNSGDAINAIDWNKLDNNNMLQTLKDMISIRKEYPLFRYTNNVKVKNNVRCVVDQNNVFALELKDEKEIIYLVIKNNYLTFVEKQNYELDCIFDGKIKCLKQYTTLMLDKPGVYLYRKGVENNE